MEINFGKILLDIFKTLFSMCRGLIFPCLIGLGIFILLLLFWLIYFTKFKGIHKIKPYYENIKNQIYYIKYLFNYQNKWCMTI